MYEETFGTDWEHLGRDELIRRAYALGVADALGTAPEGELERLASQVDGRYGRSLVELAYDEGRTHGRTPRPGADDEDVWAALVEGSSDDVEAPERSGAAPTPRATDRPGTISSPTFLAPEREDLDRLDLPDFLR